MNLTFIRKFIVKMKPVSKIKKNGDSFMNLAKKNMIAGKGKKENLALKIDEVLYGKQ